MLDSSSIPYVSMRSPTAILTLRESPPRYGPWMTPPFFKVIVSAKQNAPTARIAGSKRNNIGTSYLRTLYTLILLRLGSTVRLRRNVGQVVNLRPIVNRPARDENNRLVAAMLSYNSSRRAKKRGFSSTGLPTCAWRAQHAASQSNRYTVRNDTPQVLRLVGHRCRVRHLWPRCWHPLLQHRILLRLLRAGISLVAGTHHAGL